MKKKLERLHLRERLQYGYRTVILLMLFSGIISLISMGMMLGGMTHYVNNVQRADTAVKTCQININIAARSIREMALNPDTSSYTGYKELVEEKLTEVGTELEVLRNTDVVDDALLKKYKDALT